MLSKLMTNAIQLPGWMKQYPWVSGDTSWQKNLVLGLLGTGMILYAWRRYDIRNLPPGPAWRPFKKELQNFETFGEDLEELVQKYGEVFSVWKGNYMEIYVNGHSAINEALVLQGGTFACRPLKGQNGVRLMDLHDDIFGVPYQSPDWNTNKNMLTTCLQSAGFGSSGAIEDKMIEQIELLLPLLDTYAKSGDPLNLNEILPKVTVNVISQVLMSKKYEYDDPELAEALRIINNFMSVFSESIQLNSVPMFLIYLLHRDKVRDFSTKINELRSFVRAAIEEHLASINHDDPRDFIDLYINKSGGKHTMERMVDNVLIMLPDACDTMVMVFNWLFLYVARYDEAQQKIADEIQDVTSGNRCITWADKPSMPYTEATIMEILRLQPVFPHTAPHTVERDVLFKGYRIPAEIDVIFNLYSALRDPLVFDNPEEFRPERFLDDKGRVIRNDKWIPFGMGRRKCAGQQITKMETFLMMSNIIQKYRISFHDGVCPVLKKGLQSMINLAPDFRIKLTART